MTEVQIPELNETWEFPDNLSDAEIEGIIAAQLPRFRQSTLSDVGQRIGRGATEGTGGFLKGAARLLSMVPPTSEGVPDEGTMADWRRRRLDPQAAQAALEADPLYQAGETVQQTGREFYTPNPARDEKFVSVLAESAGQLVPTLAAGVVGGPLLAGAQYGLAAGESAAQEARAAGKPDRADMVFLANAGLAAVTEAALGAAPRFLNILRRSRESGVRPETFGQAIKEVGAQMAATGGKEASQETLEQLGGNLIARYAYDPERGVTSGVGTAAAAGAILGGGIGGAAGALGQIGRRRQAMRQEADRLEASGAPATAAEMRRQADTLTPEEIAALEAELEATRQTTPSSSDQPQVFQPSDIPQMPPEEAAKYQPKPTRAETVKRATALDKPATELDTPKAEVRPATASEEIPAPAPEPEVPPEEAATTPIAPAVVPATTQEGGETIEEKRPQRQEEGRRVLTPSEPISETSPGAATLEVPSPTELAAPVPTAPTETSTGSARVAEWVKGKVSREETFDWRELFAEADEAFGGTQAQGKYTPKDAYDAMELGVNRLIVENPRRYAWYDTPELTLEALNKLTQRLATQSKRTEEQDEFQQFSTPPPLAFVANLVADIQPTDVVLEPSAGIGGLAVFSKAHGATTIVNELSPRRRALLEQLGFDRVFGENAEQLHNILPPEVQPTVVVMNPPFSSTAGRITGERKTANAKTHLEQALKRLQPGGRLVAIVGRGMALNSPVFSQWWNRIQGEYNVRANVEVSGKEYVKYGTAFDNRLLVIDKTGPTAQVPVTGRVESVKDLIPLLANIRSERSERQRPSDKPAQPQAASAGEGERPKQPATVSPPHGVGPRDRGTRTEPEIRRQPSPVVGEAGVSQQPGTGAPISGGERGGPGRRDVQPGGLRESAQPAGGGGVAVAGASREALSTSPGLSAEQRGVTAGESEEGGVYESYQPQIVVPGAKPHPSELAESAAMASVPLPKTTYQPKLPKEVVTKGELSAPQLETTVLAGQAHGEILPDGTRKGFFIGDGTGVGKGREIAAILWDNYRQGRKKAVWVSENAALAKDAKRDIAGIGWNPDALFELGKVKAGKPLAVSEGVLFVSYDTLKTDPKAKEGETSTDRSRLKQIVDWLGKDFDGVIAFDESHNMGNAVEVRAKRGRKKPALKALAGVALQKELPKARIVYVSATGATEVVNLSYAQRLGLWGEGTPFASASDFVSKIASGGVAAMELVARDMKALGSYLARNLNFRGVDVDRIEHALSTQQTEIYNELAGAWQIVLQNINEALQLTDAAKDSQAKMEAKSQFWGAHQRFFNQVVTSMQMPTVIARAKEEIAKGNAVVMQLVNTNEASQERALAQKAAEQDDDFDDLDLTPRDQLMQFIERSFPVTQYETYLDEGGNERSRPVKDSKGNFVQNADAVAMRDALLERLGSIRVPEGPLEIIINQLGKNNVAEITGRKRRVVTGPDGRKIVEKRSNAVLAAETDEFMADKRRALVFSQKGGTGRSFHADRTAKNQRKRIHFLVQPGWRADKAVQGFGRTHRSNQAQPPTYVLVTTSLKAQKRFISSIARRLDQLGALTKGHRKTGGQGFFSERDNLESDYARDALHSLFMDLYRGRVEGFTIADFQAQTGLSLVDNKGNLKADLPPITQFLNRLLSLKTDLMDQVFDEFEKRMSALIRTAEESGTLDQGLEDVKALRISLAKEQTVYTHPQTGAQTKYVALDLEQPTKVMDFEGIKGKTQGFVVNRKSGKLWAIMAAPINQTQESGAVDVVWRLRSPTSTQVVQPATISEENFERLSDAEGERRWNEVVEKTPKTHIEQRHFITGLVLPIWDRLPSENVRIMRVTTEDGRRFIGRLIPPNQIKDVLEKLGAEAAGVKVTPAEAMDKIVEQNFRATLANEWTLRRRMVSGEPRIELGNVDLAHVSELRNMGVLVERIQFRTRYFVPTGQEGVGVLERVLRNRPIIALDAPVRSAADAVDDALSSAIDELEDPGGQVFADPFLLNAIGRPALRALLIAVRAAYRATRDLAAAIETGIEWLRANHPAAIEDEGRVRQILEEELAAPESGEAGPPEEPPVADGGEGPLPGPIHSQRKKTKAFTAFPNQEKLHYFTQTEKGREEFAASWIEQHDGDLNEAVAALFRPETPGMDDALKIVVLTGVQNQAMERWHGAANDVDRMRWLGVARETDRRAQEVISHAGQALQSGHQRIKLSAASEPVLAYWRLIGHRHQALAKRFPDVESDAIRNVLSQSADQAIEIVTQIMANTKAVTSRILRGAVKKADTTIREILEAAVRQQRKQQAAIYLAIRSHPALRDLPTKDASELSGLLSDAWTKEREKLIEQEIRKRLPKADAARVVKAVPDLIRLANLGALDNATLRNLVAPEYGLPEFSEETARRIYDLAQQAQEAPAGVRRNKIYHEIEKELVKTGVNPWDLLRDIWYSSVLMGFRTWTDVFTGSAVHGFSLAARQAADAAVFRGKPRAGARILLEFFDGLWEGVRNAADLIKTGDYSRLPDAGERFEKLLSAHGRFDTLEAVRRSGGWASVFPGLLAFTRRFMTGLDYAGALGTRDASLIYNAVLSEDGEQIRLAMRQFDKAESARALQQAKTELGSQAKAVDVLARRREILEDGISSEIRESATRFGKIAALNADPVGIGGEIYRVLSRLPFWVKAPAGLAFLRAAVNMAQNASDWMPIVGGVNYLRSRSSFLAGLPEDNPLRRLGVLDKDGQPISEEHRRMILAAQLGGLFLTLTAWALFMGDDEDGPKISGSWNGLTPKERSQLLTQGERPLSIKVGNTWVSYRNFPMAGALVMVGNASDRKRFKPEKWDEDQSLVRVVDAWLSGLYYAKDLSTLSQLSRALGQSAFSTDERGAEALSKGLADTLGSTLGGFIPAMVKDADYWMDDKLYRPNGAAEYWLRSIPFARRTVGVGPALNALGEPIEIDRKPLSRLLSMQDDDPVLAALAEKASVGVFLPVPGKTATVYDPALRGRRQMNDKEFYLYQQEAGRLTRERLTRDLERFKAMTPQQAERYFETVLAPIRERARARARSMP